MMISRKEFLRGLVFSGLALSLPFSRAFAKRPDQARSIARYRLEPQRGYKYPPSFLRLSQHKTFASVEKAIAAVRNPTLPFSIVKVPT